MAKRCNTPSFISFRLTTKSIDCHFVFGTNGKKDHLPRRVDLYDPKSTVASFPVATPKEIKTSSKPTKSNRKLTFTPAKSDVQQLLRGDMK
jgi:hypothetical protein